jgi:hypothetical protein
MMTDSERVPPGVDPATPTPARLSDYFLGGTDNYEIDRAVADAVLKLMPELSDAAWVNRGFHRRAARWIAARGVRQFIDIGAGLPTMGNTHEAVHQVGPGARVIYADIDPAAAAHGRDLLARVRTARYIQADVRDPEALLGHPDVRELIDLTAPVGLLMSSVLHFVSDEDDPRGILAQYLAAVVPGSYLALTHVTADRLPPRAVAAGKDMYRQAGQPVYPRDRATVTRFFDGLELVAARDGDDPSVSYAGAWGAEDPVAADSDGSRLLYAGVARRP